MILGDPCLNPKPGIFTRTECKVIKYKECEEVPKPLKCSAKKIRIPFQTKVHRVKCLLPDDQVMLALLG